MKEVYHLDSDVHVIIKEFPQFTHYTVAFGEVRTMGNNMMASEGVAEASCWHGGPTVGGQAIPGHDLPDPKYRVSAVAPKSRTAVHEVGDKYVNTPDIVGYMTNLRPIIGQARRHPGDIFSNWDEAELLYS